MNYEIMAETPNWIHADPNRLRQVLINLISNSLKFTIKGSVCLLAKRKDQSLSISVIDTGIGMSLSEQKGLF